MPFILGKTILLGHIHKIYPQVDHVTAWNNRKVLNQKVSPNLYSHFSQIECSNSPISQHAQCKHECTAAANKSAHNNISSSYTDGKIWILLY